jgi:glycosyltransferase involved in cell wall biosynthesis
VPIARLTIPTGWVEVKGEPDHEGADRIDPLLAAGPALSRRLPARALVHAHTAYPDGNAAAHLARRLGLPLVITEHSTFLDQQLADPPRRAGVLAALHAAVRVVTVSETLAGEMREAIPEIAHKLSVIPNVVATDEFRLADPRERRKGELIFVGYLRAIKGIDLLLDAFARVHAARPGTVLRLVGKAPTLADQERWTRQVEDLRLGDAVRFDGPADRAGVVEAMSRASILVHAGSRETFGVVAVEALSTGLPVVVTDSGGITEVLGDEPDRFGRLVRSREPEAFAEAILDVVDHPERFDPASLRAGVEDRFNIRAVSARIVDLYEEVLADAARDDPRPRVHPSSPPTNDVASARREPAVVVAFDERRVVDLLVPLPRTALEHLTVVTSTPALERDLLALGVARVMTVDPEALYRRMLARAGAAGPRLRLVRRAIRVITDPLGPWRRRKVRAQQSRIIESAAQLTLLEGVRATQQDDGKVLVICVDGVDFDAVRPLLGNRAIRFAPGGLRWLADREAAIRASGSAETAREAYAPVTAGG